MEASQAAALDAWSARWDALHGPRWALALAVERWLSSTLGHLAFVATLFALVWLARRCNTSARARKRFLAAAGAAAMAACALAGWSFERAFLERPFSSPPPPPPQADAHGGAKPAHAHGGAARGWDCSGAGRYLPGAIEREWISHGKTVAGKICAIANSAKQVEAARRSWLAYTAAEGRGLSAAAARPSLSQSEAPSFTPLRARAPTLEQRRQLSAFVRHDGSLVAPIEPLTGVARHPLSTPVCGYKGEGATDLFDISYLVLANACDESGRAAPRCAAVAPVSPPPKNLFFDLGCTVYGGATEGLASAEILASDTGPSATGPSLPLFFQMYEKRCIEFDELYGWEAKPYSRKDWWRHVPSAMRSRVHFYNVPIREGSMRDALVGRLWADAKRSFTPEGVPSSFLHLLNRTARTADFVVVKVDIDKGPEMQVGGAPSRALPRSAWRVVEPAVRGAPVRTPRSSTPPSPPPTPAHPTPPPPPPPPRQVMRALAELPELTRLVDEVFFEDHFYFDGRDFGWGKLATDRSHSVDAALGLMQTLRKRGVRSHFWI